MNPLPPPVRSVNSGLRSVRKRALVLLAEALLAREGFDWKDWATRTHALLVEEGALPKLP